jgi:endonuclease/exonuclease/phosphatase family metal-dependent hydrolase
MTVRKYVLRRGALAAAALALVACRDLPADAPADGGSVVADAAPPDATPGPHPGELWVMAWNIQTFPKAVATVARVAQVMEGLPVDVVGVEEIDDLDAFAALDDMLPDYTGLTASNGDGYSRVGLFYRGATVHVDGVETLFLGDGNAFPRPPLAVHVVGQGVDVTVVVVHLKALGDVTSEARRKDAVMKLDAWMQAQLAASPGKRYLVMGDWNDEVTDAPPDNVFQPLLDRPDLYDVLTLPLAEMPAESTYIPIPSFIDHMVLTKNALPEWGAGETEVMHLDAADSQYQMIISDHRPVMTKFRPAAAP